MSDPTDLGEIVVTGQRRRGPGAFPIISKGNDSGGTVQQEEVEEGGSGGGGFEIENDPCSDPTSKVVWNADAAAVAAVAAFIAKSQAVGDNGLLSNREFGTNLVRDAAGGVTSTYVDAGPALQNGVIPSVTITGPATLQNWMGDVHNHPSGIGMPSAGEWYAFQQRVADIISAYPQRAAEMAHAALYIVVGSPPNHQIFAFKRSDDPNQPGQEVNPAAQSCGS